MAEFSWADPEIWTSTSAAAIALGVVAAGAGAWGAWLWRGRMALRRQTRTALRQTKIVGQFQAISPLRAAIERLGARADVGARVAAVEALKEEARGSARAYWAVMEALTGHLRRHARASPGSAAAPGKTVLPADIQAIVTFLLHRNPRHEGRDAPLDLRGVDLSHADLRGVYLRHADLRGADFSEANLRDADLRYADLRGADLRGANLQGANLRDAQLTGANFHGADLRGADLTGATFDPGDLAGAKNIAPPPDPAPDQISRR